MDNLKNKDQDFNVDVDEELSSISGLDTKDFKGKSHQQKIDIAMKSLEDIKNSAVKNKLIKEINRFDDKFRHGC